ncbi:hypothetical protein J2S74_002895 [Evansella vedderi]|uniref:Uncharacterized protein n=1 Tax=Evansella vedderi TaxID=38282 RepID=A0ABT9ZWA2_9BACI|nr:hypothetical protein [Evansella vedderi]MDQ0255513.1 hypothetical protein [Evansella vedderi]
MITETYTIKLPPIAFKAYYFALLVLGFYYSVYAFDIAYATTAAPSLLPLVVLYVISVLISFVVLFFTYKNAKQNFFKVTGYALILPFVVIGFFSAFDFISIITGSAFIGMFILLFPYFLKAMVPLVKRCFNK